LLLGWAEKPILIPDAKGAKVAQKTQKREKKKGKKIED
jgi:hypothetical protein